MVNFLVRTFVKNYEDTGNNRVRTAYGVLSSFVGIGCNIFLFILKMTVGMVVNSVSVMSDAFNNLSDAASSIVSFVGVKMASRPADEEHPFGHGRMEYVAALIVSFLVIEVGWTLLKSSVGKILNPEEMVFSLPSVLILAASVAVKLWMSYFNRTLGKRIHSSVMLATAADSLGDVLATTATVFALAVYGIWGINVDGIVGLGVSVVVIIAGINITKDTLAPLLGQAISPEVYQEISKFVESYDGIVGSHDLIVHDYGPGRSMASIHAEVPNDVDIEKSHEIIDRIERDAMTRLGVFLVIHMDPVAVHDERVTHYRELVKSLAVQLVPGSSIHDFRIVPGEKRTNLIFDLVVPREIPASRDKELAAELGRMVQEKDDTCCCVITVERSFCAPFHEEKDKE